MNRQRALLGLVLIATTAVAGCGGNGQSTADNGGTPAEPAHSVEAGSNKWFIAASTNSDADLAAAAASGQDVNAHENRDRYTPLHTAATAGNDKAIRFMVQHGARVNEVDEDGRTALMLACY